MTDDPLYFLILIALLAVFVILMVGIGGFGAGGEFNAKHGNRMMRWRIIAQAVAIALVLLFVAVRG
ncbi:twin transmembrane helix small protein [Paracoccus albus]|uniref:twin transmembrane helix small protein n=1 Tax=Paracoccus albus TaxID=3017784 RepID=UPI0022F0DB14|nr:twin transmembrane helix small protein [Paracoccus albus]WBU59475.1 twin transmembrane helix small protein [Paracoccus albus]